MLGRRIWNARHYPYETADALGDSDDEQDLRDAHERLVHLGGRPRALHNSRAAFATSAHETYDAAPGPRPAPTRPA